MPGSGRTPGIEHPGTVPFTPTSASWMNAVEGPGSKPARQRLQDAVLNALAACITAVEDSIGRPGVHDGPHPGVHDGPMGL